MADTFFVEPDLSFIKSLGKLGGTDLKKCFQCATCSVACKISPEKKPFPRKEMIAASWGLKDRLIGNGDVWLCHNCGDCSSLCPRGAKPADVLSAIRTATIINYARPQFIAKAVNDPKKLPLLLISPALLFLTIGLLLKIIGIDWLNFTPIKENLWQNDFINNLLVDLIMLPTITMSMFFFLISLKNFLYDMHSNALLEGKSNKKNIDFKEFFKSFILIIPTIIKHDKFNQCEESQDRSTPHMMILFAFIGLFIVTQCFFIAEWIFHIEGPYSQINPIKWLGNISGIALVVGGLVLLVNRINKKDQINNYNDWFLIGLVLSLGLTGMLTEMSRLANAHTISAIVYFLHLISVWCLFAYIPFSKLAHLLYRITAMTYQKYSERK